MASDDLRDGTVPQEDTNWRPGRNGGRLRAWPAGSRGGNPSGVSRKRLIANELNRRLAEDPKLVAEIAATLIDGARAGDPKMMAMLLDRADGLLEREAATVLPMIEVIVQGRRAETPGGSGTEGTSLSGPPGGESRTESAEDPKAVAGGQVQEVEVLRLPAPSEYDDEDEEGDDDG